MYLLDTVTISELRRRKRDPGVVAWMERQRSTDVFLSVISIGEIERGISKQRTVDPDFAVVLAAWLDRIISLYGAQILPFGLQTARHWGGLSAALGNDSSELMIAATALEHGLTVVTRNARDFEPTGVRVFNPFGHGK